MALKHDNHDEDPDDILRKLLTRHGTARVLQEVADAIRKHRHSIAVRDRRELLHMAITIGELAQVAEKLDGTEDAAAKRHTKDTRPIWTPTHGSETTKPQF